MTMSNTDENNNFTKKKFEWFKYRKIRTGYLDESGGAVDISLFLKQTPLWCNPNEILIETENQKELQAELPAPFYVHEGNGSITPHGTKDLI